MTPRQIKEMRDLAMAFASIIAVAGIVWIADQLEKHRSPHKLTTTTFQTIIK